MDPHYDELVAGSWRKNVIGTPMFQIVTKLRRLKPILKEINRNTFGDIHIAEEEARIKLLEVQEELQHKPMDVELRNQEKIARTVYETKHKAYMVNAR